jgi:haloacetate dehalogenase
MAADQMAVMRALGFERFRVLAHDRGARGAPAGRRSSAGREKLVTLDIAPLAMYAQTNEAFARAYYHWFFLIRPAPFPRR